MIDEEEVFLLGQRVSSNREADFKETGLGDTFILLFFYPHDNDQNRGVRQGGCQSPSPTKG